MRDSRIGAFGAAALVLVADPARRRAWRRRSADSSAPRRRALIAVAALVARRRAGAAGRARARPSRRRRAPRAGRLTAGRLSSRPALWRRRRRSSGVARFGLGPSGLAPASSAARIGVGDDCACAAPDRRPDRRRRRRGRAMGEDREPVPAFSSADAKLKSDAMIAFRSAPTPCVKICVVDPVIGLCIGCGRTPARDCRLAAR